MMELRLFEMKVQELYRAAQLPGFVHLYVGEEAVGVGVCANLRSDDVVYSTHRGHGHALAKGVPARDIMAELFGKASGCSGGRGGSMHLYSAEHGFMGSNGIVGSGIPLAAGAALSAQLAGRGKVAVGFFGDGAVNTGSFHEGLNLAATWNLPVVYVCENNLYATEMAFHRATRNVEVASRAAAYGVPGVVVDGNDVLAVYEAAGEAVASARNGKGPTLMECRTYRVVGHHEGDPGTGYRTKEEVAAWKQRCPIGMLRERLLSDESVAPGEFDRIEQETARLLEEAVVYARESPEPSASTIMQHVFCEET
jgi:TPP-dependent pyruvate/acetoin dehydrogenase alpha subunit